MLHEAMEHVCTVSLPLHWLGIVGAKEESGTSLDSFNAHKILLE